VLVVVVLVETQSIAFLAVVEVEVVYPTKTTYQLLVDKA
jgi:hypothetical protein